VIRQKAAGDGGWNEFTEFLPCKKLMAWISHGREIQAVLPVIKAQNALKSSGGIREWRAASRPRFSSLMGTR
jgi:hypothetical protein